MELKVVSSCGNDARLRQVTEAMISKELNLELNAEDERGTNASHEKDRIRRDDLPNSFEVGIIRTRKLNSSH